MKNKLIVRTAIAGMCLVLLIPEQVVSQVDNAWQVSVNGQTTTANGNGRYRIRNIPIVDQFGPAGPGSARDFISDDYLRVVGSATFDGVTYYALSTPFQLTNDQIYVVPTLTITTTPPPLSRSIRVTAPQSVLEPGQTVQLTSTALLQDNSMTDVTLRSAWTTYRTSNTTVASVNADGLVTAVGPGVAAIVATNEAATAVKRIDVANMTILTTVEGFVQLATGTPVQNADVTITLFGGTATTGSDGHFVMPLLLPSSVTGVTVQATYAMIYEGLSQQFAVVEGGISDAGIITLMEAAPLSFAEQSQYGVGSQPRSVALDDLDGDMDLDIAVGSLGSSDVTILLNDGSGVFSFFLSLPVISNPRIVLGDLDNDDDSDLAVANGSDDSVSIFLNNGDATFGAPSQYTVGFGPRAPVTSDLDADMDLDLSIPNFGNATVSVLLNDGAGVFSPLPEIGVGGGPRAIVVGDLDGDDDLDAATASNSSNNVSILLNDGNGNFAPQAPVNVGSTQSFIAAGDFDGVLGLDLAVTLGTSVAILLNDGTASFATVMNYSAGVGPEAVAVADFNADGAIDLTVADMGGGTAAVLLNNGDGTFAAATEYSVGPQPWSIAVGDVDGDSDLDVVTANYGNNTVSVLLNQRIP